MRSTVTLIRSGATLGLTLSYELWAEGCERDRIVTARRSEPTAHRP